MSFDETSFVGLEIFLGIQVVRILLYLVSLGLIAVVNAFLEVVLDDVHFSYDALNTH